MNTDSSNTAISDDLDNLQGHSRSLTHCKPFDAIPLVPLKSSIGSHVLSDLQNSLLLHLTLTLRSGWEKIVCALKLRGPLRWAESRRQSGWPAQRSNHYDIFRFYHSRPRIASAVAEDCYILVVLFFIFFNIFFRPPNFRHPWAYFRETLPHDAVCAEIVYLL